jgi:hypothetical protein
MNTSRLFLFELCGEEETINELKYIESFTKDSIDPMEIDGALDSKGYPVLPDGSERVEPGQGYKGRLMPPLKVWDGVNSTIEKGIEFTLPGCIYTCKDKWMAFRFSGGKLYGRSAAEYEDLYEAKEVQFHTEYSDEIKDGTCFAVKSELLSTCRELSDDQLTISVRATGNLSIGIRTPDFMCVYVCNPLTIEENVEMPEENEEKSGAPENQETVTDANEASSEQVEEAEVNESEEETVGSEPEEDETDSEEEETEEETEDPGEEEDSGESDDTASDGGDASEKTTPASEDVDPLEAYDVIIPDLIKDIQEEARLKGNELKRVLKNATKQARKAIKSSADPAEVAELKRKLASETKRADKAEKELKEIKDGLSFLKSKV